MKLESILKIVILIVGAISAFFLVRILLAGEDAIKADVGLQDSLISPFIVIAYIVFVIAVVAALLFTILNLLKNPTLLKRALIGIGAFLVIIILSFVLAKGEVTTLNDGRTLSESGTKWVSTGLITFYFLIVIAIGLIAYTGIRKAIK
ncbi:hypothetical protein [Abyssalbus ytuae]|uniref:Uncharacterized protein n=1 Tax=Abyssalbus ytuae TaxID=2926907 RepID=A0A9E6ZNB9_9FLAO|nr:hypothetical protein [Abyssalbus ytuae]UOB19037.1 hypothetical protein MQE35_06995 [Abyssalbus ytuae]